MISAPFVACQVYSCTHQFEIRFPVLIILDRLLILVLVSDAQDLMAALQLDTLGQLIEAAPDAADCTRVLLCAVARLFNTLLLTRWVVA